MKKIYIVSGYNSFTNKAMRQAFTTEQDNGKSGIKQREIRN